MKLQRFPPGKFGLLRRVRANDGPSVSLRRMQPRAFPRKRQPAALKTPERLCQRRDRVRRIARVDTDEISGTADRDAVIIEPQQFCGCAGYHVEAAGELVRTR